jgi:catechol 2,3-dioxygenase-like lactoylglutathione lyase family enzyme
VITGSHLVMFSPDAEADRAFLRDVLGFAHVDAGSGWLIFKLPPAEVAVHPADGPSGHELFLMCDDVEAAVRDLAARGVECAPIEQERWGSVTRVRLPSGADVGLYEPRHPRATDL